MASLFSKLVVWKKSVQLTQEVYRIAARLPKYEEANLIDQMRRSVVSITSNIAESQGCFSVAQRSHFLKIAYGSAAELESQLHLVKVLRYVGESDLAIAGDLTEQVLRMLNTLIRKR